MNRSTEAHPTDSTEQLCVCAIDLQHNLTFCFYWFRFLFSMNAVKQIDFIKLITIVCAVSMWDVSSGVVVVGQPCWNTTYTHTLLAINWMYIQWCTIVYAIRTSYPISLDDMERAREEEGLRERERADCSCRSGHTLINGSGGQWPLMTIIIIITTNCYWRYLATHWKLEKMLLLAKSIFFSSQFYQQIIAI